MAVFKWEGISPRGEVLRGEMEAPTRDAVIVRLRTQRIQPVPAKIREKGKGLDKEDRTTLKKAFELIASGLSVKEASFRLGYKQLSHLSREFKRFHGVAPSELPAADFSSMSL